MEALITAQHGMGWDGIGLCKRFDFLMSWWSNSNMTFAKILHYITGRRRRTTTDGRFSTGNNGGEQLTIAA